MMKKIFSVLSVLLVTGTVVFASGVTNSSTTSRMAIIRNGSVIKVIYKPESASFAKVSIVNSQGVEIFRDYVKTKNGFSRPYNISRLPAGTYTVKVSDSTGDRSEEIVVGSSKKSFTYKVDKLTGEENKYALFIPVTDVKKVDVLIYNRTGDLVYRTTETIKNSFARIYNLKKVEGEVNFVVEPK